MSNRIPGRHRLVSLAFIGVSIFLALRADSALRHFFEHTQLQKGDVDRLVYITSTIVLAAAAWCSNWLHESLVWRILPKTVPYRGGWWLYALVDDEETPREAAERGAKPIAGYFQITQHIDRAFIKRAQCFYYDEGNASNPIADERCNWSSQAVWITADDDIEFIYDIRNARAGGPTFLPTTYKGYMGLIPKTDEPKIGTHLHCGVVVSITGEHAHGGFVYCERLGIWTMFHRPKGIIAILKQNVSKFVEKAKTVRQSASLSPRRATPIPPAPTDALVPISP